MNNKEIQQQINEITKQQFEGAVEAFNSMEVIRIILINIRICLANLHNHPDAMALAETANIIEEAIIKLESSSKDIKDSAKQIGQLINQLEL